jgi:hypothetical protein
MSVNKASNKKVSFREVGDTSYTNVNRSNTKKTSILKSKTKNRKKEEEKVEEEQENEEEEEEYDEEEEEEDDEEMAEINAIIEKLLSVKG